jgi:hypothetical protein
MEESNSMGSNTKPASRGFFQKWFDMYFSPDKSFRGIDEKPDWIWPVLVVAILSALILIWIAPIMHQTQVEHLMAVKNLSRGEAEQMLAKSAGWQKFFLPLSTFIMIFISQVVVAFFFYLVGTVFLGGAVPYVKVLAMWAYTSLAVGIVAMVVRVPIMLSKKTIAVQTNLAAILSADSKGTILYKILTAFDVFMLWQLVLMTIGFTVIFKFSGKKSATAVFGLWAVWVILSVLLRTIFKMPGMGA